MNIEYRFYPLSARPREAYEFAWRRATSHFNQAEKQTFTDHPIFITGGGSLIPGITEALSNDPARLNFRRRVRPLERPHDLYTLDDKPIPNDDLVFLSAAYGLSYHPDEIPPTYETDPEPRLKERYIGLGVIYEK